LQTPVVLISLFEHSCLLAALADISGFGGARALERLTVRKFGRHVSRNFRSRNEQVQQQGQTFDIRSHQLGYLVTHVPMPSDPISQLSQSSLRFSPMKLNGLLLHCFRHLRYLPLTLEVLVETQCSKRLPIPGSFLP
jgi:hypothetical protein